MHFVNRTELGQFGVLQRGYTVTPSEQVEVACFERPPDWYPRLARHRPSYLLSAGLATPPRHEELSGVVVLMTPVGLGLAAQRLQVTIAVDYSSEVSGSVSGSVSGVEWSGVEWSRVEWSGVSD